MCSLSPINEYLQNGTPNNHGQDKTGMMEISIHARKKGDEGLK
jgi:hypothetical protein